MQHNGMYVYNALKVILLALVHGHSEPFPPRLDTHILSATELVSSQTKNQDGRVKIHILISLNNRRFSLPLRLQRILEDDVVFLPPLICTSHKASYRRGTYQSQRQMYARWRPRVLLHRLPSLNHGQNVLDHCRCLCGTRPCGLAKPGVCDVAHCEEVWVFLVDELHC